MPDNPRQLTPAALLRLLNSTSLGTCLSRRRLQTMRDAAGLRVGDGRSIDLLRFAAWLCAARHAVAAPADVAAHEPASIDAGYAAAKERARARSAGQARTGRDIGPLPAVADRARKESCCKNFRLFCELYFATLFFLGWSDDHLKVIARIERVVLEGGLLALAMPRGSGKSTLAEIAALWALIYGHRAFVVLIGAGETHAAEMLASVKMELETNELLLADFPEVCYPIHRLEGISNRCKGQLLDGERTYIGWTKTQVVLPTVNASAASGAILKVAGITGRLRGMKYKRRDGRTVRPDLVIPDDPQTDESANSLKQCETRERTLAGAILGLAGPGQKIAGIMPCTVIRQGDMADRILDRTVHPEWGGERMKMVYSFPTNERLWAEYGEIRAEGLRTGAGTTAANEFYRSNREAMDLGSIVAWPENFDEDEQSGLQHAMNLKLRDEDAFWAEGQNEPRAAASRAIELTADQIAAKINRRARFTAPRAAEITTAMIDVQLSSLWWAACAFERNFTGYVAGYGIFPDQTKPYVTLRDVSPTLSQMFPGKGKEGWIYAGLEALTEQLLGKPMMRDDGARMWIDRLLIDANWGPMRNVVYQFCRQSKYSARIMPSHGVGVKATERPFAEHRKKEGERLGHNWRIPAGEGKEDVRRLLFDTNFWKSFCHSRLAVAMGDAGCLSIFGDKPGEHRLFIDHLLSEFHVPVEARGRTVDEWFIKHAGLDNHLLDCLVGCLVAASVEGATLEAMGAAEPKKRERKRIRLSEVLARKRRGGS